MALLEKVNSDLKEALKAGASLKVSTLRMALAAAHNREIEKRVKSKEPLTDEEVIDVLRKEIKKRREAIEIYSNAGRNDLKEKEAAELGILQFYLPPELSEEEIEKIVRRVVRLGKKDFGSAMKEVMKEIKGRAESKKISELIKKVIAA